MLFTVPIFYSQLQIGSPNMRNQQWDCYAVFGVLLLSMLIRSIWVSSFLLLSLGHFFFFQNPFSETHLFQTVISSFVFYVFSTYEIKSYKLCLFSLLLINMVMAVTQHFQADVYTWMTWSENGMLGLPASLGMLSALVAPVICLMNPFYALLGVLGVFWSKSTFCVLALVVSMCFMTFQRWKKHAVFLMFVPLVFVCFYPLMTKDHINQSSRRFPVWKMVVSKAFRSPFFGWGMGSFDQMLFIEARKGFPEGEKRIYFQAKNVPENQDAIKKRFEQIDNQLGKGYTIERWDSPHSHYIDVFYGYGFIGMFLLIGFISELFSRLKSKDIWLDKECIALYASFVALLIVSSVHFPMSVAKLSVICCALVGMLDRKSSLVALQGKG